MLPVVRPRPGEPLRGDGWGCNDRTGTVADVAGPPIKGPRGVLHEAHLDSGIHGDTAPAGSVPGDAVELLAVDRITKEDHRGARGDLELLRHRGGGGRCGGRRDGRG